MIEFDAKPDCTGLGRLIVNGKYYGLPVDAVKELELMTDVALAATEVMLEIMTGKAERG